MPNRTLVRALFLGTVALAFGSGALQYPLGDFARAGPGLFPLLVSCMLLAIAIATAVQSRLVASAPLSLKFRNIGIILLGFASFAVLSKLLNMTAGVVALIFISSAAGTAYSWKLNLKVCAVLLAIAFAFQKILGLNLNLI